MAQTQTMQYSVFPTGSVPRISLPDPYNRKPSLSRVTSTHSTKESVIITMETGEPMPPIPHQHRSSESQESQDIRKTPSPDGGMTLVTSPEQLRKTASAASHWDPKEEMAIDLDKTKQSHGSPEPDSTASTVTLVREGSPAQQRSISPIVAIRSMFPTYNPDLPLSRQSYHPQRPAQAHRSYVPTSKYSIRDPRSLVSSGSERSLGSRLSPAVINEIAVEPPLVSAKSYSSSRALERLWEATRGTESNRPTGSFDLEMARTSDAFFVFGSNPEQPFYTVTTYDTNEISITKTCPRERTLVHDIILASIEPLERRLPPADGTVACLFPKMAAMLAIDQSNTIAHQYGLAPAERDEVQANAMRRAASQEASTLRYNHVSKRYELHHPAVARYQQDPNYITSPTTPQENNTGVLHITVTQSVGQTRHGKPLITVTHPDVSPTPAGSAGPGVRASIVGQSEVDNTLASLDFHTNTLHINATKILDLMPSLFAVDSIVSALTAVAVADQATNVVMENMDIWLPPPRRLGSPNHSAMSWGTASAFYATIAEREDAEAEAKAMELAHRQDMKAARATTYKSSPRSWFGRQASAKKSKNKKKQVVIGEFDLEKLDYYQSGSRKGQELPALTRGAVHLLVSGLKLVVWFLTALVQLLTWILVAGTSIAWPVYLHAHEAAPNWRSWSKGN